MIYLVADWALITLGVLALIGAMILFIFLKELIFHPSRCGGAL